MNRQKEVVITVTYNELGIIVDTKAEPRKRGEWIDRSDGGRILHPWWESYECEQCGYSGSSVWNFCPNCGADMRGGEKE